MTYAAPIMRPMSTYEHEDGIRRRRDALLEFFTTHKAVLKNPYRWAKAAGIGYVTLAEYMAGTRDKNLRADTYEKLAEGATKLIGVPITVANLLGDAPLSVPPPQPTPLDVDIPGVQLGAAGIKTRPKPSPQPIGIPEIDIRAGMGGGGLALLDYRTDDNGGTTEVDAVRGRWDLPVDYLTRELHVIPSGVRIIEVQGDSMYPTLQPGDRVMVDTNDRTPSPPGIFALWDGLGTVVKRVEFIPNTDPLRFVISSDNPAQQKYERTAEELNIIGRIVWYGRRM